MIKIRHKEDTRINLNKYSKILLINQNNKCNCCGSKLNNMKDYLNYHIDHIVPLASLKIYHIYGTNDIENLQLLCNPCHKWKTREFEKKKLVTIILEVYDYEYDDLTIDKFFLLDKQTEDFLIYHFNQIEYFNSRDIKLNELDDIKQYIEIYDKLITDKFDLKFLSNNLSNRYISYIINLKCNFIHSWAYLYHIYEQTLNNKTKESNKRKKEFKKPFYENKRIKF